MLRRDDDGGDGGMHALLLLVFFARRPFRGAAKQLGAVRGRVGIFLLQGERCIVGGARLLQPLLHAVC